MLSKMSHTSLVYRELPGQLPYPAPKSGLSVQFQIANTNYPFHACPMKHLSREMYCSTSVSGFHQEPKGLLVHDQGFIGALPVLGN